MKKKLWCISFCHDDAESEQIYHVRAITRSKAIERATKQILNDMEIYHENEEQLDFEIESNIVTMIAFEVIESEILK